MELRNHARMFESKHMLKSKLAGAKCGKMANASRVPQRALFSKLCRGASPKGLEILVGGSPGARWRASSGQHAQRRAGRRPLLAATAPRGGGQQDPGAGGSGTLSLSVPLRFNPVHRALLLGQIGGCSCFQSRADSNSPDVPSKEALSARLPGAFCPGEVGHPEGAEKPARAE